MNSSIGSPLCCVPFHSLKPLETGREDARIRSPASRGRDAFHRVRQLDSAIALMVARAAGTFVRRDGMRGPAKFYGARSCAPVNLALLHFSATRAIMFTLAPAPAPALAGPPVSGSPPSPAYPPIHPTARLSDT